MKTVIMVIVLLLLPFSLKADMIERQFVYTATGDDGSIGQASRVVLRVAMTLDSLENHWSSCTILADEVPPDAGVQDSLFIQFDATTGAAYYFGCKIADEVPNWSELSNVVTATFLDTTAPGPITDAVLMP